MRRDLGIVITIVASLLVGVAIALLASPDWPIAGTLIDKTTHHSLVSVGKVFVPVIVYEVTIENDQMKSTFNVSQGLFDQLVVGERYRFDSDRRAVHIELVKSSGPEVK